MRILVIGPVGSGKTTQATLLAESLSLPTLRVGDLVRSRSELDDEVGRICHKSLHSGHLVPDEIIAEMVVHEIENMDQGFVTDSYPRRLSQLKHFDPHLDLAIHLSLDDEVVKSRLAARHREDDKPEVVAERLHVYHSETEPILDYYRQSGKLVSLPGIGDINTIQSRIQEIVNSYGRQ